MNPSTHARSPRPAVLALAAAAVLVLPAALAGCGGGDDLMSRQEFVDNLGDQGDGLINEAIASCMYDGLSEDDAAADAVREWEDGEDVPVELLDLATECLRDPPETPEP